MVTFVSAADGVVGVVFVVQWGLNGLLRACNLGQPPPTVIPRKPVAHNENLLSQNFLLLWLKVAHNYGELGFLGSP